MSVAGVKRKHSGKQRPKKRSKGGQYQVVEESNLPWKEVDLPDHLEDAEGFFGLEEIDDVEVVRDESSHGIRFRTKLNDPQSQTKKPLTKPGERQQSSDEESEFNGFEDDNSLGQSQPTKSSLKNSATANGTALPFSLLPEDAQDTTIDLSEWDELDLSPDVMSGISNVGFAKPTIIQKACIPDILAGHDVIGKASTGSGKTLAFGIPILHQCLSKKTSPTAMILSPTRELAHQLAKHLSELFDGVTSPPRIATVTGGLSIQKQERLLSNADVIIATPGRLWEVIQNSHGLITRLKKVRTLVVDEADRLLSEGHFQEVGKIIEALEKVEVEEDEVPTKSSRNRQVLVFSATFHKGLQQKLAGKAKGGEMLDNKQSMEYLIKKLPFRGKPKFIDVNPASQMVETLKEGLIECGPMEKDLYLYSVLLQNTSKRTLVFTNSISAVRRLASLLQELGLPSLALHSTMPQKARLRSVERYTNSTGSILIATDVAARGLDIKGIEMIIHYHVPRSADMYIHRSGRTARAESSGKSILLCSPDELAGVTRLIAKLQSSNGLIPIEIDRQVVNRLNPRVKLAQRITDAALTKEKTGSQDNWIRNAAEELGVDYDSEEFEADAARTSRGRNKKKQTTLSKAEIGSLRAQLRDLLSRRVSLGVSEKYLAGGALDVDELLHEKDGGKFLGKIDHMNF